MSTWKVRGRAGTGHEMNAGEMKLSTTNQSDRGCCWCWHVSVDHGYGTDEIGRGSVMADEISAQTAAVSFARSYCEAVLAALPSKVPA